MRPKAVINIDLNQSKSFYYSDLIKCLSQQYLSHLINKLFGSVLFFSYIQRLVSDINATFISFIVYSCAFFLLSFNLLLGNYFYYFCFVNKFGLFNFGPKIKQAIILSTPALFSICHINICHFLFSYFLLFFIDVYSYLIATIQLFLLLLILLLFLAKTK